MQESDLKLLHEKVPKLLISLALPMILAQMVNALYNIVDRIYISYIPNIGTTALTGVGICFPILMLISAFSALLGQGGAPLASIRLGAKKEKEAQKIVGNCFFSLTVCAILLTLIFYMFSKPILFAFGASNDTIGYAQSYLNIYLIGTIFVQMTLGLNAFISAQGFSKISMLTVCIGAVTNIVLDPIFIFGLDMGVRGAALATVLSQAISAVWAIYFLVGKNTILKLKKENFPISKDVLLPCISLGVAPFIMQSTESILVLCFNSSLLQYGGDLAVGAMTILSSCMQFAMLPLQGLTQGGQPIISYNYGANNSERVKKGFKLILLSSLIYTSIIWLIAMFAPQLMVMIFTNDADLVPLTVWALRIYMAGMIVMGAQVACQQTFIAFAKPKISTFLALFRKIIVLIPLIYLLPTFMENDVEAVFLAEPIADFIATTTTVILFIITIKKLLKGMREKEKQKEIKH